MQEQGQRSGARGSDQEQGMPAPAFCFLLLIHGNIRPDSQR